MAGILYVVPTPIGNMGDITERARRVLEEVDFVACEDTRITGKLMLLLGIKKPLVSYHEHNSARAGEAVLTRLLSGENAAVATDAGTPAISDPGEELVALCSANGVEIRALPGACAAVCAVSASGLPSRRFCFEGFLPENGRERAERISELARENRTFVMYLSPHDAKQYLRELSASFGNRKCVLCKEITKLHERYFRGTLEAVCAEFLLLSESDSRGEYVLVCEGMAEEESFWRDLTVCQHVEHYVSLGLSKMDACKQTARDRGVGKGEIYSAVNRTNED